MTTNQPREINSVLKAQAEARRGVATYEPRITRESLAAARRTR